MYKLHQIHVSRGKFRLTIFPGTIDLCCIFIVCLAGIMGDFLWMPLMKQVGPTSGIVPLSVVAPTAGEGGQLVVEVGHVVATAEVTLNAPSFILAKRERDNDVGVLGRKKSKAPLSLRALRHVVGLTHPQLIEICAPTVTAPVIPSIAFAFSPLVASISAPLPPSAAPAKEVVPIA